MENLAKYFIAFSIYSFFGYIAEVIYVYIITKKITNRGFLYGPVVPIYGFGAILIIGVLSPIYNLFTWYSPILVFILGFLLTSALEYFASFVMEAAFNMRLWDYSEHKFNINGRVCLLNSTLFGALVILVMYVLNPYIVMKLVNLISDHSIIGLFIISTLIFISFSVDFTFSLIKHIEIAKVMHYLRQASLSIQNGVEIIKEKTGSVKDGLANKISSIKNVIENKKYEKLIQDTYMHYPSFKVKLDKRRMSIQEFVEQIKKKVKGE